MSIYNNRTIDENCYDVDKFYSKIDFIGFDYCMIWTGPVSKSDYPIYNYRQEKYLAHRMSYYINNGPLINGLVIDHICQNKLCVHPEHLRQVTQSINAKKNTYSTTMECPYGHKYTNSNTIFAKDGKYIHKKCRKCRNEKQNKKRRERKNKLYSYTSEHT